MIDLDNATLVSDRGDVKSYLVASRPAVILSLAASEFTEVPEKGNVPAHYHARIGGVNVHLHGGLRPSEIGKILGRFEARARTVKNMVINREPLQYWSANLYPTIETATEEILVTRSTKAVEGLVNLGEDQNKAFIAFRPLA